MKIKEIQEYQKVVKRLENQAEYTIGYLYEQYYKLHSQDLEWCERITSYHSAYCCTDWSCKKIEDRDPTEFDWTNLDLIAKDQEQGITCECMEVAEETAYWKTPGPH